MDRIDDFDKLRRVELRSESLGPVETNPADFDKLRRIEGGVYRNLEINPADDGGSVALWEGDAPAQEGKALRYAEQSLPRSIGALPRLVRQSLPRSIGEPHPPMGRLL